ncbi:MAG: tetratricopeptide repeat protein [Acidobacteriota bacterium]
MNTGGGRRCARETVTRREGAPRFPLFPFKAISLWTLLVCAAGGARTVLATDTSSAFVPVKEALKAQKWDAAVEAGERAVHAAPGSSTAHRLLGQAFGQKAVHTSLFSQIGLAKKCRAEFETAVALDPGDPEARVDMVTYYANAPGFLGGSLEKARAQLRILNGLDSARGALMNGYVLAKEKRTAEAEKEYRRALALSPGDAGFHVRFGHFLERAGRKDEARASYREALRLDPALEGAKKDLERLGG